MAIVINGSGTVTGISVGGLPDGIVDSGTLATNSVDSAELIDGAVDNSHLADDAVDSDEIAAGAIDAAHFASGVGGKILQVVSATATSHTDASYTNNTWTDTVVTAAITPASTSNKIFVCYRVGVHFTDSTGNGGYALRCKRAISGGATTDNVGAISTYGAGNAHTVAFMTTNTGNDYQHMSTTTGVDSPGADTEVTYTVGVAGYNISGSEFQAGGQYSGRWSMVLMEIEG